MEKNSELKEPEISKLVRRTSQTNLKIVKANKSFFNRIIKHLNKQKRKKLIYERRKNSKKHCTGHGSTFIRVDNQVKLKCRQLPNVLYELRKTIMRQNWNQTATLLMILCHPGLKLYSTVIIKTCFLLLFCHPDTNLSLLQNFVRRITGYVFDEDVNKYIRILFTLRKTPLNKLGLGKYLRQTDDHKVIRDFDFKDL